MRRLFLLFAVSIPLALPTLAGAALEVCSPSTNTTFDLYPGTLSGVNQDTLEVGWCPSSEMPESTTYQLQVAVDSLFEYRVWQDSATFASTGFIQTWKVYMPIGRSYHWRMRRITDLGGSKGKLLGEWLGASKVTKTFGTAGCTFWPSDTGRPSPRPTPKVKVVKKTPNYVNLSDPKPIVAACLDFWKPFDQFDTAGMNSSDYLMGKFFGAFEIQSVGLNPEIKGGMSPTYFTLAGALTPQSFYFTDSVEFGSWHKGDWQLFPILDHTHAEVSTWDAFGDTIFVRELDPRCSTTTAVAYPLPDTADVESMDDPPTAGKPVELKFCPAFQAASCLSSSYEVEVVKPTGDTLRVPAYWESSYAFNLRNDEAGFVPTGAGAHTWRIRKVCDNRGSISYSPWSPPATLQVLSSTSVGPRTERHGVITGSWSAEVFDLRGHRVGHGGAGTTWAGTGPGFLGSLPTTQPLLVRVRHEGGTASFLRNIR